ncbi:putative aconitate hydratase [Filobasidium floriforme]|uniref:putative aconitate hydratase n=1 Tax=Filobasidium floriforme TaxID=5210 RepID=UPI001E8D8972|nr:putative aconitate hydratase [Filobasidium floriforme]KAH8082375.1 putative aconitate hydratase [Filobasidium floriforme]
MLRNISRSYVPRVSTRGFASVSAVPHSFSTSPLEPNTRSSYHDLQERLARVQSRLGGKPLTLTEKILYAHLANPEQDLVRGSSQLELKPQRVALHDANAQMALLQFISAGLSTVRVPTSVHADHLITAKHGDRVDMVEAERVNKEVYKFLESACAKYGIAFWRPGSGILHQIIFEQYAYPGGFMIGTDSHTPNAAGLGMLAIGVGGMEGVDVMAGSTYEVKHPKVIGVELKGKLGGWSTPKDIILKVASILSVKGGTGSVVEYCGPGTETISCTGMATIGNMGAEVGATSSIFPYTKSMGDYLRCTERGGIAQAAEGALGYLRKDEGAEYDRHIEINLSDLEPHINGPFTPDLSSPIRTFGKEVDTNPTWPREISAALIGSCTNSSYEDFSRAASLLDQARDASLPLQTKLLVAPGSEEIRATLERDGILAKFREAGGTILANACGACVGQWEREDVKKGTPNSIVSSFNRNFVGRQDGNPKTHSFVASPELVTAMAFSGNLAFDPTSDPISTPSGSSFRFSAPIGSVLPPNEYVRDLELYCPPLRPEEREHLVVDVDPASDRIQLVQPFKAWEGGDEKNLELLIKVKGKCTTDHISAAGPWYKYRGHLENISENLLIGAVNAENDKTNWVKNTMTGEWDTVPNVAKSYRGQNKSWIILAGENYGEGSSREVAAMSPRYMGGFGVIAKSMARIHETNLKKQGVLPLFFVDKGDYDRIDADPTSSKLKLMGLNGLAPGSKHTLRVEKRGGEVLDVQLEHSLTAREVEWFKKGSALNSLRERV